MSIKKKIKLKDLKTPSTDFFHEPIIMRKKKIERNEFWTYSDEYISLDEKCIELGKKMEEARKSIEVDDEQMYLIKKYGDFDEFIENKEKIEKEITELENEFSKTHIEILKMEDKPYNTMLKWSGKKETEPIINEEDLKSKFGLKRYSI